MLPNCLNGLKVIDITRNLPGPFASKVLRDLGADVIKLEPPEGDPARGVGTLFHALNDGKTIEKVDLKTDAGKDVLRTYIRDADVLLEGFRPQVMQDMGLDFKVLQALNPRLVMCSITGYGQSGAMSDKAGHDLNYMAMSGCLDQMRAEDGQYTLSNIQWGDIAGGSNMAVIAILAAVFQAQKTGQGSFVDISMTHGLWAHQVMPQATGPLMKSMIGHMPGPREDMLNGCLPCYNLYVTKDGRALAVGALEFKFWKAFAETVGRPEWVSKHWHKGLMPNSADSNALKQQVAEVIAHKTLAEWSAVFAEVDACVTPVLTLEEASQHALFQTGRAPWCIHSA